MKKKKSLLEMCLVDALDDFIFPEDLGLDISRRPSRKEAKEEMEQLLKETTKAQWRGK